MNKEKMFKYCFGLSAKDFPEGVIVTPFIPLKQFGRHCESVKTFKGRLFSGIIVQKNDRCFAVIQSGIGKSLIRDAVMLLGSTPVKHVIFLGAAGGINDTAIGDLVLCENNRADKAYLKSAEEFFKRQIKDERVFKKGNIFTVDSLMDETEENLCDIKKKGFIAIDMELSAFYSAAAEIKRKAVALVFVSDLPLEKPIYERLREEEHKRYKSIVEESIHLSTGFVIQR
ncbi:MAG: hypothetical protein ABH844_05135 [Candidatus Omnitrophota bacterium]